MRRFLTAQVPFYAVLLILAICAAGVFMWARKIKNVAGPSYVQIEGKTGALENFEYGTWPALSDPDFFKTVKEKFIAERASFVDVDLSGMKVRLYKDGEVGSEFPILTKGKEGSWWETPAGLYEIKSRQKSVFSGFGHVYMPYSMQFQGNFFLHGWPYYPDGRPVESEYSGGCIRLSTDDAKEIFENVSVGMPVLVYESDFTSDNFAYIQESPKIDAVAYLAADIKNNFVFASQSSTAPVPIASLTKLMTALVVVEYIDLDKVVTITDAAMVPTSLPRLKVGDKIIAYQLLFPLLMESSNEAAFALANVVGQKNFVALMNQKAKSIGMTSTVFADPAGREAGNISSAEDLFRLAKYLYTNRSFIFKLSRGDTSSPSYDPPTFENMQNFNVFQGDGEFVGGKVGQIREAGQTILSVFRHEFGTSLRPFVIIVLGSSDNAAAARTLRTYVESSY